MPILAKPRPHLLLSLPLVGLFALTGSLAACTSADKPNSGEPAPRANAETGAGTGAGAGEDTETEAPSIHPQVEIAVASVQMIQDCPDPAPAPASKPTPSPSEVPSSPAPASPMPASEAPPSQGARSQPMRQAKRGLGGGGDSFRQPCTQSTVQLSLSSAAAGPVAIELRAVRLLSDGKEVGTVAPRLPTRWVDGSYLPWDAQLEPGADAKVSYKLGMPDWTAVEEAIAGPSFGHMFTLEIDVLVAGQLETVSSSPFPREQPHVIVT